MRLTCSRQELSGGLALANHAVSSRATLPILANTLISTDQGRLKLVATNLETSITTWIAAQVEEEGTTTLPAKLLADLVNALATEWVELVKPVDTHTVQVSTGYRYLQPWATVMTGTTWRSRYFSQAGGACCVAKQSRELRRRPLFS